jgi:hypothetical protein
MLMLVVVRTQLDLYEELRQQLEDGRDVRIVLDRSEGERRAPQGTFAREDRRRVERRRADIATYTYVNGLVCGRYPGRDALLTDLAEFVQNHRLTVDATEPAWNGYLPWARSPSI